MSNRKTFLMVDSGGTRCAIPLPQVIETMRPLPIKRIPDAPAAVLGAAVIRGRAVPVLNLAALLSIPGDVPFRRFVTLRTGSGVVALALTDVVGIRQLEAEQIGSLPPLLSAAEQHAVGQIGTLDRELMLVLEAARVLPADFLAALGREANAC